MQPTAVTLCIGMLAGAIVVGSMIGLGRRAGGVRSWVAILAAASVIGGAIGSVAVYAAIQHNPHQTIVNHETGFAAYRFLTSIFLSWFLAANIATSLGLAAVLGLLTGSRILYRMLRR
jgi:CDP-diglyceride synthetase